MSKQQHHGLLDGLKNMVFDETPDAPITSSSTSTSAFPSATAVAPALSGTAAPSLSSFVASSPISSAPEAEDFYHKLADKTDFEKTEIAATIHKFLDPLAALPLDPTMKFKTAITQAKAQAGLTEEEILNEFETLKTALSRSQDSFNSHATDFEAKEIAARQNRLTEIQNQITQLQAEQTQVSSELSEAQAKSARTKSGFNSAIQRRSAEIDQQKAQYAAMLK